MNMLLFFNFQAGFEGGFWANGSALTVILLVVIGALMLMGNRLKAYYRNQTEKGLSGDLNESSNRTKYDGVNSFKLSGTFFNLGLVLSIGLSVLAFGWSEIDQEIYIPEGATLELDDIIMEEPPRTAEPPPPPPPPPPVIEEVPDDTILEDETQVDQTVTIEDKQPEVIKKTPPPPPPPPPPSLPKVDEIFKVVEQMPRFPGCENEGSEADKKRCADGKLLNFIYKHIKYPAIARENGVEGTVVITFVVEKDGSVKASKILRDIGAQCGNEALRVVELMNSKGIIWTPGKQIGHNVRVQFNLPVVFRLQ